MRAGLLRFKVRVLEATDDRGEYGESNPKWTPTKESPRRASIEPLTLQDQERIAHDGTVVQQSVTHRIKMRWWKGLTSAHALEGVAPASAVGRIWELASVADVAERTREYLILAREVVT